MSVRYRNSNTGDIVTQPGPNRRLDRLPNWQRLDVDAPPKPPVVRESELKGVRKADLQAILADHEQVDPSWTKAELIARILAAKAAIEPAAGDAGSSLSLPGGSDDDENPGLHELGD